MPQRPPSAYESLPLQNEGPPINEERPEPERVAIRLAFAPSFVSDREADRGAQARPFLLTFDFASNVALLQPARREGVDWLRWQPPLQLDVEPYQRKAIDFQQRCLNMCRVGGWGSCELDSALKRDDCNGIAARSLISAVARRMPVVSDALRLMGSKSTKLATDRDPGVSLSARMVQGGLGLGIEAKW